MPPRDTLIYAIRHGETAWNKATRIQGQLDIPLNETGLRQADAVGRALAEATIDAIYSSDLIRAVQTATPLAQAKGLNVVPVQGLRERHFGVWQGETYGEIEEKFPHDYSRWRLREPEFAVEGAENLIVFQARMAQALQTLAQAHPGQTIAVFTHGGCLDILYRLSTGLPLEAPRTWPISNAVVNRLRYDPEARQPGLHLESWAEAHHLDSLEA
jgi:probable phosphoglycerate mutase